MSHAPHYFRPLVKGHFCFPDQIPSGAFKVAAVNGPEAPIELIVREACQKLVRLAKERDVQISGMGCLKGDFR
jgi:hypothetical protein